MAKPVSQFVDPFPDATGFVNPFRDPAPSAPSDPLSALARIDIPATEPMMLERIVFYAGSGLVTALAAWVGVAAILQARKRFGHGVKVPLWFLFVVLWVVTTLVGFVGGAGVSDKISLIAIAVLVIGILVYLVSLPITKKTEKEKIK